MTLAAAKALLETQGNDGKAVKAALVRELLDVLLRLERQVMCRT